MKICHHNNDIQCLIKSGQVEALLLSECPSMDEKSLTILFGDFARLDCKIINIKKCRLDELSDDEIKRLGFLHSQLIFTHKEKHADSQKLYYYVEFIYEGSQPALTLLNEEY